MYVCVYVHECIGNIVHPLFLEIVVLCNSPLMEELRM